MIGTIQKYKVFKNQNLKTLTGKGLQEIWGTKFNFQRELLLSSRPFNDAGSSFLDGFSSLLLENTRV